MQTKLDNMLMYAVFSAYTPNQMHILKLQPTKIRAYVSTMVFVDSATIYSDDCFKDTISYLNITINHSY